MQETVPIIKLQRLEVLNNCNTCFPKSRTDRHQSILVILSQVLLLWEPIAFGQIAGLYLPVLLAKQLDRDHRQGRHRNHSVGVFLIRFKDISEELLTMTVVSS